MKVLIAENNELIQQQLCDILEKEGYTVVRASSGTQAIDLYRQSSPDFVCLDIMMDDVSGHDVCREIRKENSIIPIVFITSKSSVIDKVTGLELGADDYIVKPFDVIEVTARMRAFARRSLATKAKGQKDDFFQFGDLKVFPSQLRFQKSDGKLIDASLREIKILQLFYESKGKVINRDVLLDHCWGAHIMPESRTVDWHMSQLRKKIEQDPAHPALIKTVHGAGYIYEGG